jgi:AcrR family transcriptional regulator
VNDVYKVNMIHETTDTQPSGRQRRRAERVDTILETAEALLVAEGIEGLTIQRLASELGYSGGALYRYFESKDAILAALVSRLVSRLDEVIARCESASREHANAVGLAERPTALLALVMTAEVYRQRALARPEQFHLIGLSVGTPQVLVADEVARPMLGQVFALFLRLAALFDGAVACGALAGGSGAERALLWWSSLQGLLQLRKLARFDALDIDSSQRTLTRTLLIGWGATPADVDAAAGALPAWISDPASANAGAR